MEHYPSVATLVGPRPLWLTYLPNVSDWNQLLEDEDWQRVVQRERSPFGLFTASGDPAPMVGAWHDFADHCVQHELRLVSSWGENSTVLDDIFDMAAVVRHVDGLPTSEPLTSWHDDEPLAEALEFFLSQPGTDLAAVNPPPTEWARFAVVVGDRRWYDELRAAIS